MPDAIVPIPRCEVSIRPATLADLPFIDDLQKRHTKMVGWMPNATLRGKIEMGHVLVAEENGRQGEQAKGRENLSPDRPIALSPRLLPLGYCIGNDKYMKREELGIIYQLNVVPGVRRKLVGASLIKAMFDRAAYGCRLFCCWCAQDIEANRFWESIGFIPLAFRAGSRGKGRRPQARVHIFWQRRIREGDTTTPWWFPSQTSSGAIREDRLVLPIPPGTHWSDAKPVILPGTPTEPIALPAPRARAVKAVGKKLQTCHGLRLVDPPKAPKPKRQKRPKVKNDPAHVAAARELRDRYLEQFNAGQLECAGKYDVCRAIAPKARKQLAA